MESFKIENLSFSYSLHDKKTLDGISLEINDGEFVCLCGKSGCGKTTLLRMMKPVLSPHGKRGGQIYFFGNPLEKMTDAEQASRIGFVMQDVESQIVTDKVWHELSFGLESLGVPTNEIRSRVSEMAEFFGISNWFYRNVCDLSGGEKQILNLAAVMVMMPEVLILDEPTSQLDPIAAKEFINTVWRINRELGITVIISEHRLEDIFPISDRVFVMDGGKIIAVGEPADIGKALNLSHHEMADALPTPMRIYNAVDGGDNAPLTIRDGRQWLKKAASKQTVNNKPKEYSTELVVSIKDIWFRYEKNTPDVIKGLSLDIAKGELYAIIGGNGVGKSTALSLISRVNKPYRGKIKTCGKVAMLPQNPQLVFTKKTIGEDLKETKSEIIDFCGLESLLDRHPYDLSGGEIQRAALAKILTVEPDILLLDEPTKGLDAHFKIKLAHLLKALTRKGIAVIIVSHDIEFCAEYADRCSMFFDGAVTAAGTPQKLLASNSFYTTATARMSRGIIDNAVVAEDIINILR